MSGSLSGTTGFGTGGLIIGVPYGLRDGPSGFTNILS